MVRKSLKTGFTLIELLVVIGIIGLLMSILVPVLHKVRLLAGEKVCASNLRQINLVLTEYSNISDQWYPLEPTEHNPHLGLLKVLDVNENEAILNAMYCPQDYILEQSASDPSYHPTGATDSVIDTPENRKKGNISYIYWSFEKNKLFGSVAWRDPKYFVPRRLSLTGAKRLYPGQPLFKATAAQRWVLSDFFRKRSPIFPHGRKSGKEGGGVNVVFLDGHVDLVTGRPRESYR